MRYDHDKDLNPKIFMLKIAHLSNDLDGMLFEEIFGHRFVTLANKLINTTSKEENQVLINDIEKNRDKIYEQVYSQFVIKQAYKRGDLIHAVKIILEFNESIQLDLV